MDDKTNTISKPIDEERDFMVRQAVEYCQMTEEQASDLYDNDRHTLQRVLRDEKRKWAKTYKNIIIEG